MNDWMIENLGYTLVHSLWQIGLVALGLFLTLRILPNASANLRYYISVMALCLSLALPIATFVYLSTDSKTISPIEQQISSRTESETIVQNNESRSISQNTPVITINSTNKLESSRSLNFPVLPVLVALWVIGVIGFSIRLLGGIWTTHLYRTRNVLSVSEAWQNTFDELCKQLQTPKKIKLLQSKRVATPVVIGWLKPVILIPASAFLQIPPQEIESILMHELVHIIRRDYLVNYIQSLIEILFFYHPGVWWISSQIRHEREFAVDEFVSRIFDRERFIYAQALANLEEIRLASDQLNPTLVMAGTGGNLMKRIEKILQGNRKISSRNISIWSAVFTATFILGIAAAVYWFKTSEVKNTIEKTKSGRKIAIVYTSLGLAAPDNSQKNLFDLQMKHPNPTTLIINGRNIDRLIQDDSAQDFFRQMVEHKMEFVFETVDADQYLFENESEYVQATQRQIKFVKERLAQNGRQLRYFNYSDNAREDRSEVAQRLEKLLIQQGLKFLPLNRHHTNLLFSFAYEKKCLKAGPGATCLEKNAESEKNLRTKYLKYVTELIELNENYSRENFGRETPQVLSLAVTKLNQDSAQDILQMLKDRGYEFVPLEAVISDEAYQIQQRFAGSRDLEKRKGEITSRYLEDEISIIKNRLIIDSKTPLQVTFADKEFNPEKK